MIERAGVIEQSLARSFAGARESFGRQATGASDRACRFYEIDCLMTSGILNGIQHFKLIDERGFRARDCAARTFGFTEE